MRREKAPLTQRLPVLVTVIATLSGLLSLRVVWLGTVADPALASEPTYEIPATRGSLWDRHGALLAAETYRYEIGAVPAGIDSPPEFAAAVAPLLGKPLEEVLRGVEDPDVRWSLLAREVEADVARALEALDLAGLHITPIARRAYPLGAAAAHVTGFINLDGDAHYGVEAYYDDLLRGAPGRLSGALGTSPEGFVPASDGSDLVLTIDRTIQLDAAEALGRALVDLEAEAGSVIVLEPSTGDVLASVSLPSYDPNKYGEADPETFLDPVVSAMYEPGSVVKAMTMASALESGAVAAGSSYFDDGVTEYGGIVVSNWDRSITGWVSMTDLLQHSLNVGAVHLAAEMGPQSFYRYLADFGFGAMTDIDLFGEIAGLVRTPENDGWYPADLATNSFGQGIASTPIQVAAAMGALANDGRLMKPRVVSAHVPKHGEAQVMAPQTIRQVVSAETAREVRRMLRHVVTGYAVQAEIPGYTVAGKTGTSEIPGDAGYENDGTIASFAGFLPVEQPRVVILVTIARPNTPRGSDAAAPVFKDVAEAAISAMEIPPDLPGELLGASQ